MQLRYTKMHGAGNQIVIVDRRDQPALQPDATLIAALRAHTPGERFDQLMWLEAAANEAALARYRVFNYDGSEVEQCGNGVRCVAVLLAGTADERREILLESPVGDIDATVTGATAAVAMGQPRFDDSISELQVNGQTVAVHLVSMGNPHCVLDVADTRTADVAHLGPAIEQHRLFPERINVGFMQVINRQQIRLRVYERGAGETLACGTGACAAVASGQRRGLLDESVAVDLPGGQLMVSWRGNGSRIWLSGHAELISEGTIDL